MIRYSRQLISSSDIKTVNQVLKSDFLTQGPKSILFEKKLSSKFNVKYSTSCNSATSALHLACLALGVKKGDHVWTCTNSFVASASCALHCGAKIDLVDINSETYNLDINSLLKKLKIAYKKKKLPKVVIPVHFAGLPCEMREIHKLSKKYKFKIVEDASHAVGAKYYGSKIGSCKYSDITIFSFHPVKIMTTAEGGAALTNSKELDFKLKFYRSHGITKERKFLNKRNKANWYYECKDLGFNYRLNDIQSALGISQLKKVNKWLLYRNKLAKNYQKKLKNLPIEFFSSKKEFYSSYHLFIIKILKNKKGLTRDNLFKYLHKKNIQTNVHYIPIHTHPFYKKLGFKSKNFPNAEHYFKNCLSLPMHVALKFSDQNKVINLIKKFFK
tara:strand:+ start:8844 stop:10001 length:1158 start_codon:yes stop_codon:yes gene_type:complete